MEKDINVADILKDKPANTRLYSPLFGYVYLLRLSNNIVEVSHHGEPSQFYNNARYFNYHESEPLLFPSKEMRDWSKFAWKKGDVLSCGVDNLCIFEKWANGEYTEFYAKFVTPNYSGNTFKTEKWSKETNEAVIKQYISNIEEFKEGKLNLTTLEIEKPKRHEFKDGDIVALVIRKCTDIAIFQSRQEEYIGFHAVLCQNDKLLLEEPFREDDGDIELRPATDSEKLQLLEALAKENKAWDVEKKQIVDLKPKWTPKPFDRVITRTPDTPWTANFFSHIDSDGVKNCIDDRYIMCLPYNEETAKLIGTTDDWKGGEQ